MLPSFSLSFSPLLAPLCSPLLANKGLDLVQGGPSSRSKESCPGRRHPDTRMCGLAQVLLGWLGPCFLPRLWALSSPLANGTPPPCGICPPWAPSPAGQLSSSFSPVHWCPMQILRDVWLSRVPSNFTIFSVLQLSLVYT